MTQYTQPRFSVMMPGASKELDERWERTFGKKEPAMASPPSVIVPEPPKRGYPVSIDGEPLVRLSDVFALFEKEAEKSRLNGDTVTAELWELARAKLKVFEK